MHIDRRTLLSAGALWVAAPSLALAKSTKTKRLEIGKPVPGFKLRTPKERHVYYLRDFAFPGKPRRKNQTKHPVLLDFFRTDCEPCIRSMPELVQMHEKYGPKGLKVVVVALHEKVKGREKLHQYLGKTSLPFLVLEDPLDYAAKNYLGKMVSLPATFLIDSNGVLVDSKYDTKKTMEEAFGDKIEGLLKGAEKSP